MGNFDSCVSGTHGKQTYGRFQVSVGSEGKGLKPGKYIELLL